MNIKTQLRELAARSERLISFSDKGGLLERMAQNQAQKK
jgi:hypothetical protein